MVNGKLVYDEIPSDWFAMAPEPLKTTNTNVKCALSVRPWMLHLKMYGYHMEGKVLFILKSLSLVNHGRMGLDWRRITSAQAAGTNAIISLLVQSLSVHPNPVRHNETDPEGHSRGPIQNTLLPRVCHQNLAIPSWFVLNVLHNNKINGLCQPTSHIFSVACGWLTTEIVSSTNTVHPITPPSCWILHSYLFAPMGAACNGTL